MESSSVSNSSFVSLFSKSDSLKSLPTSLSPKISFNLSSSSYSLLLLKWSTMSLRELNTSSPVGSLKYFTLLISFLLHPSGSLSLGLFKVGDTLAVVWMEEMAPPCSLDPLMPGYLDRCTAL